MNRLRNLRLEKNESLEVVAKYLNVTIQTVSNYETGKREMNPDTLLKLSNYYNVSIDYLLGKSDIRNPEIEIDKDKINIGLSIKDYNPPTKEQQEKIETNIPDANLDTLKSFLSNDFNLVYNSLSRIEKRRIWLSVIDYVVIDKDYNMKIFFI